jgi:translation initiation factor 2 alpha subunit (eIF-2alpha)
MIAKNWKQLWTNSKRMIVILERQMKRKEENYRMIIENIKRKWGRLYV